MTRLPERRDPDGRVVLKPRPDDAVAVSKLPDHRRGEEQDRQVVKPRTTDAVGFTKLPAQRHSDEEVMELRRREAMRGRPSVAHLRMQIANPLLLGLGYGLAAGGGIGGYFVDKEWRYAVAAEWSAVAAAALGMLVALFIALKKPRSRHHAAFIAIIALLVIVFVVLYLVQLEDPSHAT